MAEVQTNDHGEGGKNKQKKQTLRVDFTPMVDMNMLLITFFMLCTSLLKPQTMNINMPSKDDVEEGQETKIAKSSAITLLLGANNEFYYYRGMPAEDGSSYEDPEFLQQTDYTPEGIRKLLIESNTGVYGDIQELKLQKKNNTLSEDEYREQVKELQSKGQENKVIPTVMIKPSDLASFKNMVDVLDEMLVCNIGFYTILDITEGDRRLLFEKTKNIDYLTEEERAVLEAD